MQYLVIHCLTEKQKSRLSNLFIVDREYEVKELTDTYSVPFEFARNINELRKIDLDDKALVLGVLVDELSTKEQKADVSGVEFYTGMPLHEFLTKNPHVRTINELTEYYTTNIIKKAERQGLFLINHNKIVL